MDDTDIVVQEDRKWFLMSFLLCRRHINYLWRKSKLW